MPVEELFSLTSGPVSEAAGITVYLGQFPAKTRESLSLVPVSTTPCFLAPMQLPRLFAAQVSHWFGLSFLLGREKEDSDKMHGG